MAAFKDLTKGTPVLPLGTGSTFSAKNLVQEPAEEPFILVRGKSNGRKWESATTIRTLPQSRAISEWIEKKEVGSLPGWTTTRKPRKPKKNSQRAMMGRGAFDQEERTIEWGIIMLEDKVMTLKQSKFYSAFHELTQLTLCPPCKKQHKHIMDSTMQLHPRTAADQTLEPVDLSHEPEAGNATSQEIGAEVCAQREKIVDIICYGIGSVESSRNSQFQIALALCLKDILRLSGTMSIFDPVMTEYDKQLAEKLGLHVLKANDQANQVLSARTLLYMPHCPKGLYSHVLEANWSRKHLDNMVILGNRFTMYDESPSFRQFAKQAPFILPALTIATVHGLPETKFEDNTVFNDLAFHCFPADKILPDVDVQGREVDPELL